MDPFPSKLEVAENRKTAVSANSNIVHPNLTQKFLIVMSNRIENAHLM